jgi:hypothetical protein
MDRATFERCKLSVNDATFGLYVHFSVERGSLAVVSRGTIDAKGKGAMTTYWLESIP